MALIETEGKTHTVSLRHTAFEAAGIGAANAESAWKISPWAARESDIERFFGPEAQPGPIVAVIGDGVAAATSAKSLAKDGYRVLVFGSDEPGGQAFSKIDEVEHHATRAGGVRIVAKGLTEPGILYIPRRVDLGALQDLADTFSLSGIVVAAGGSENLNRAVDYSIPGVFGMWDFINMYHEHMNAGRPVSELDLGLSVPKESYPGMTVVIQGAGRGVEDIGRKIRYLQSAVLSSNTHVDFNDGTRSTLFAGPRDVPGHKRMLHNIEAAGIPSDGFGPGIVIHRGSAGDFKWNDPKDRDMSKAILTVQQNKALREQLRALFDANPKLSSDKVFEMFVRKYSAEFRQGIEAEVTEWLEGYHLIINEKTEIVSTRQTVDNRIEIVTRGPEGENTIIADMLITSLGSKGLRLPVEEIRSPDGTFLSASVTRSNGLSVPVRLAGMSFDGRGAVGPSVKHAESVVRELKTALQKNGGSSAPVLDAYARSMEIARQMQKDAGFSGDIMRLLIGNGNRHGAFPEFYPEIAYENLPASAQAKHAIDIVRTHIVSYARALSTYDGEAKAQADMLSEVFDPFVRGHIDIIAAPVSDIYQSGLEFYVSPADAVDLTDAVSLGLRITKDGYFYLKAGDGWNTNITMPGDPGNRLVMRNDAMRYMVLQRIADLFEAGMLLRDIPVTDVVNVAPIARHSL